MGLALVAAPGKPLPFDDALAGVTSQKDVHRAVMKATVVVLLPCPATGFLVWKRGADDRPRVFLVTAAHVLKDAKPGATLKLVARRKTILGKCESKLYEFDMYDRKDNPLWLEKYEADVAVFEIVRDLVPCVAISVADLATTADVASVELSDEVFATGYPSATASSSLDKGYYAFLKSGRVTRYPLDGEPDTETGMYFDAAVPHGYSGSPLYWFRGSGEGSSHGTVSPRAMVVGVVTAAVDPTGTGDNKRDPAIGYARLAAYARELIEKAK